MSLCKHLRAIMKQRSICYTYYKLKKFLSCKRPVGWSSVLGSQAECQFWLQQKQKYRVWQLRGEFFESKKQRKWYLALWHLIKKKGITECSFDFLHFRYCQSSWKRKRAWVLRNICKYFKNISCIVTQHKKCISMVSNTLSFYFGKTVQGMFLCQTSHDVSSIVLHSSFTVQNYQVSQNVSR